MEDFSNDIIPEWESITWVIDTSASWGFNLIDTIFLLFNS